MSLVSFAKTVTLPNAFPPEPGEPTAMTDPSMESATEAPKFALATLPKRSCPNCCHGFVRVGVNVPVGAGNTDGGFVGDVMVGGATTTNADGAKDGKFKGAAAVAGAADSGTAEATVSGTGATVSVIDGTTTAGHDQVILERE